MIYFLLRRPEMRIMAGNALYLSEFAFFIFYVKEWINRCCRTKYQISGEKIRGKILTIRCKSCGARIQVRESLQINDSDMVPVAPAVVGADPQPPAPLTRSRRRARIPWRKSSSSACAASSPNACPAANGRYPTSPTWRRSTSPSWKICVDI